MTTITVRDVTRDEIVAQGEQDQNVILLEGSFYFAPDDVKQDHLIITQRTYTCPYKIPLPNSPEGICERKKLGAVE